MNQISLDKYAGAVSKIFTDFHAYLTDANRFAIRATYPHTCTYSHVIDPILRVRVMENENIDLNSFSTTAN
jgi:hypothetical protein